MATILLLALTVTLFASVFAWVTAVPTPPAQNNNQFQASIVYTSNGLNVSAIRIVHLAGPSVPANGLVYLKSATQPTAPEFATPYTVASGLPTGSGVWNLGQTWNVTFHAPNLPMATSNITVYIVASSALLFSIILPGANVAAPPTIVSTSISPAVPAIAQSFTVYASVTGSYASNSVYVNLAAVPGAPTTPQKMTLNAQGQWTYTVAASVTTTAGTYYGFVNASTTAGAGGQSATAPVTIIIASSGTINGPFSVGVILLPSPPNVGTTESVQAVVTYTGVLSGNQALNVSFAATPNPYVAANKWTGWAPSGATITGGTSVTVVSKSTWTIPAIASGTSFTVYANATVSGTTVPGTTTFTPAWLTSSCSTNCLLGSPYTVTGSYFAGTSVVGLTVGGVTAAISACSSDTSFTASTVTTTSTGGFSCTFNAASGTSYLASSVVAYDATSGQNASATFNVADWSISPVSPTSGLIGSTVTVTGVYFAASSTLTVSFNGVVQVPTGGSSCTHTSSTITTNASGRFVCTFPIPSGSASGAGTFTATDSSWSQTATATFTVTAWTISPITPASGRVGITVNDTGSGFQASSTLTLTFDGISVTPNGGTSCSYVGSTITVSSAGAFTCTFVIPYGSTAGAGTLVATDSSGGQTATATFTVTSWVLLVAPATVSHTVTHTVWLNGTGFAPSSQLTITINGTLLTSSTLSFACGSGSSLSTSAITTTYGGAFYCTLTLGKAAASGGYVLFMAADFTSGQTATGSLSRT